MPVVFNKDLLRLDLEHNKIQLRNRHALNPLSHIRKNNRVRKVYIRTLLEEQTTVGVTSFTVDTTGYRSDPVAGLRRGGGPVSQEVTGKIN
ncbi:hypothetical protein ElyMa_000080000 [Elysia marginata]|uniref:Uncharacterized protein n=1 Tax=Elysia marginata TaxID=1093978 RepID=A0AAV4EHI8_9GAST|nr:hypothetical protein ElyMa_000080000 [Elysia marginata]